MEKKNRGCCRRGGRRRLAAAGLRATACVGTGEAASGLRDTRWRSKRCREATSSQPQLGSWTATARRQQAVAAGDGLPPGAGSHRRGRGFEPARGRRPWGAHRRQRSHGWRAWSAYVTWSSSWLRACRRSGNPAGARQGWPSALCQQVAAIPARPPPTGGGGSLVLGVGKRRCWHVGSRFSGRYNQEKTEK